MLRAQSLIERRAVFVYEAARLQARAAEAPIVPAPWLERELIFREQFLNVIERECGPDAIRHPETLHAQWVDAYRTMGWRYGPDYDPRQQTHPDLVPYDALGQPERDKDAVFVALCDIARQWIR
jgi:RyR domain